MLCALKTGFSCLTDHVWGGMTRSARQSTWAAITRNLRGWSSTLSTLPNALPGCMDPARLSAGIACESAQSLIASVRRSTSVPSTFVSGLDALVEAANCELRRGDVVEIQGLPASGKSELMLYLAATALLMRTAHVRVDQRVLEVPVGGKEESVVWLSCAATACAVDLDRLAGLLRHQIVVAVTRYRAPRGIGAPRDREYDVLVEECLARLHVFSPTSMLQLAVTLRTLPEWAGRNAFEPLGTVLLDGMSELAWLDQHDLEQKQANLGGGVASGAAPTAAPRTKPSDQPPVRLVCAAIAHLRRTLAPLVFISQWVFRPRAVLNQHSQDGLPFYAHHYAPPFWPSITTAPPPLEEGADPLDSPTLVEGRWPTFPLALHITLHPRRKPTFRAGTSLEQVRSEVRRVQAERATALEQRGVGTAAVPGLGTEGVTCVVRRPGGVEIGSWDMSIFDKEVVT